jgi:hypothetical protein
VTSAYDPKRTSLIAPRVDPTGDKR